VQLHEQLSVGLHGLTDSSRVKPGSTYKNIRRCSLYCELPAP